LKGDITHYFAFSTQPNQLLQPFIAHTCSQHVFYHRQFAKRTLPHVVGDHGTEKQPQSYRDVWKRLFNLSVTAQ